MAASAETQNVVGGDQGNVVVIGERHQSRLGRGLRRRPMPLQLDVEPVAEHARHLRQSGAGVRRASGGEQRIDRPVRSAGEQDQALARRRHPGPGHAGVSRFADLQIGGRRQGHQIAIAGFVLGQQDDGRNPRPALRRPLPDPDDRQGAADDGLDARLLWCRRKTPALEQVGPVGKRHRRHAEPGRHRADRLCLDGAFENRIGSRTDPGGRTNPAPLPSAMLPSSIPASRPRLTQPDAPPNTPSKQTPPPTQAPSIPERAGP